MIFSFIFFALITPEIVSRNTQSTTTSNNGIIGTKKPTMIAVYIALNLSEDLGEFLAK